MNEVGYQSLYLNPAAERWEDRIVFHDPIADHEMAGVAALKSLRLEKMSGLVVAGPKPQLRRVRQLVADADKAEHWGALSEQDILQRLLSCFADHDLEVVYRQGSAAFFDPATQYEIIRRGPQFFDPSLPSLDKNQAVDEAPFEFEAERIEQIKASIESEIRSLKPLRHTRWTIDNRTTFSRKIYFNEAPEITASKLRKAGYNAMILDTPYFIKNYATYDVILQASPSYWQLSLTFKTLPAYTTGQTYSLLRYGIVETNVKADQITKD